MLEMTTVAAEGISEGKTSERSKLKQKTWSAQHGSKSSVTWDDANSQKLSLPKQKAIFYYSKRRRQVPLKGLERIRERTWSENKKNFLENTAALLVMPDDCCVDHNISRWEAMRGLRETRGMSWHRGWACSSTRAMTGYQPAGGIILTWINQHDYLFYSA